MAQENPKTPQVSASKAKLSDAEADFLVATAVIQSRKSIQQAQSVRAINPEFSSSSNSDLISGLDNPEVTPMLSVQKQGPSRAPLEHPESPTLEKLFYYQEPAYPIENEALKATIPRSYDKVFPNFAQMKGATALRKVNRHFGIKEAPILDRFVDKQLKDGGLEGTFYERINIGYVKGQGDLIQQEIQRDRLLRNHGLLSQNSSVKAKGSPNGKITLSDESKVAFTQGIKKLKTVGQDGSKLPKNPRVQLTDSSAEGKSSIETIVLSDEIKSEIDEMRAKIYGTAGSAKEKEGLSQDEIKAEVERARAEIGKAKLNWVFQNDYTYKSSSQK